MTQKPRKSDFGELKKKKKIHGVHASDPPRSLRLRRSFWKTVSISPRSAPVSLPTMCQHNIKRWDKSWKYNAQKQTRTELLLCMCCDCWEGFNEFALHQGPEEEGRKTRSFSSLLPKRLWARQIAFSYSFAKINRTGDRVRVWRRREFWNFVELGDVDTYR